MNVVWKTLGKPPSSEMMEAGRKIIAKLRGGLIKEFDEKIATTVWREMWEAADVNQSLSPQWASPPPPPIVPSTVRTAPPRDWFPSETEAVDPVMKVAQSLIAACAEHVRKVGCGSADANEQVHDGMLRFDIDVSIRARPFVTPIGSKD